MGRQTDAAFRALQEALAFSPILVHSDFDKQFVLFTDASDVTVGDFFAQINNNKVNYHIFYYSKTLSKAKRNYIVTKRECLVVLLAIKHFLIFLYGTHFRIIIENFSLCWLQQMKNSDGRLSKWAFKIQHHNFSIVHSARVIHENSNELPLLPPCDAWVTL